MAKAHVSRKSKPKHHWLRRQNIKTRAFQSEVNGNIDN